MQLPSACQALFRRAGRRTVASSTIPFKGWTDEKCAAQINEQKNADDAHSMFTRLRGGGGSIGHETYAATFTKLSSFGHEAQERVHDLYTLMLQETEGIGPLIDGVRPTAPTLTMGDLLRIVLKYWTSIVTRAPRETPYSVRLVIEHMRYYKCEPNEEDLTRVLRCGAMSGDEGLAWYAFGELARLDAKRGEPATQDSMQPRYTCVLQASQTLPAVLCALMVSGALRFELPEGQRSGADAAAAAATVGFFETLAAEKGRLADVRPPGSSSARLAEDEALHRHLHAAMVKGLVVFDGAKLGYVKTIIGKVMPALIRTAKERKQDGEFDKGVFSFTEKMCLGILSGLEAEAEGDRAGAATIVALSLMDLYREAGQHERVLKLYDMVPRARKHSTMFSCNAVKSCFHLYVQDAKPEFAAMVDNIYLDGCGRRSFYHKKLVRALLTFWFHTRNDVMATRFAKHTQQLDVRLGTPNEILLNACLRADGEMQNAISKPPPHLRVGTTQSNVFF